MGGMSAETCVDRVGGVGCVCVGQEAGCEVADGNTVQFDHKGKGGRSLLFGLDWPEETPLFL